MTSRPTFRARTLDAAKPMAIHRAEELPELDGEYAINRAVPALPTGMEKEEEAEKHLQDILEAQNKGLIQKMSTMVIPTPEVEVETKDIAYSDTYKNTFKQPRQYIHVQPFNAEGDIPDYDMDEADIKFFTEELKERKKFEVSMITFEDMIDRLEKNSGQTIVTIKEAKMLLKEDDDLILAVFDYWLNKRLETQQCLIPSVKTEVRDGQAGSNVNPYIAFRRRTEKMQTRKNRKNDEESYIKMLKLRRDLNRAVLLLEMVKKREKLKKENLNLTTDIFDKRYQGEDWDGSMIAASQVSKPAMSRVLQPSYPLSSWVNSVTSQAGPAIAMQGAQQPALVKREKRTYRKRKHKSGLTRPLMQGMFRNEKSFLTVSGDLASSDDDRSSMNTKQSDQELDEIEDSDGPFTFRRKAGVQYHEPSDEPWSNDTENKFPFMLTAAPPRYSRPVQCLGFSRRRLGRGGRVVIDRIPSKWDEAWSQGPDLMDFSEDASIIRPVTPPSLEEVVWDPYKSMISVTMDLMDMSELPVCPVPDLASLSSSPPQAPPVTSITDISTFSAQPQPTVTGKKSEAHKKLNSSGHQATILNAAHEFCESQQYADLQIQCEDGTVLAHQMMLAVSSPFLRQLFPGPGPAGSDEAGGPAILVLPEVKISLVQALLHFLYTGKVVTREGQFYSLMKLVYALNINASIDAESTPDSPTLFNTKIVSNTEEPNSKTESESMNPPRKCSCGGQVIGDKSAKFDIDSENNLLNSISFNKVSNSLAVNRFTASGVVVKEELDEKPDIRSGDKTKKTDDSLQQADSGLNAQGTNQFGHFVSVNSDFQIKMEVGGNGSGVSGSGEGGTVNTSSASIPVATGAASEPVLASPPSQEAGGHSLDTASDDPLAAIMNQTIFGGDTMFIQVNTNSYLSAQNSNVSPVNGKLAKDGSVCKDEDGAPIPDDGAPVLDDDDLNVSYNCDTCNKPVKGKVMLQAHKFQEHHENPDFEASAFPDDKFACRVCLKLFTRNSDVKAHILRVHCGDRRYPCTTCGKRFKESTHLRKHLYTHTGERPHFCSLCAKGFQTSSDLKRHKKTRIHQEKVEQAAGNTVAAVTAAANAANAAAAAAVADVSLEFGDWADNSSEDKDINANPGAFPATNPRNTSLPFPGGVTLPTEPCPPEETGIRVSSVSNTFTTTSVNFINQNTAPYTNNHSASVAAVTCNPSLGPGPDQKPVPGLWPGDDGVISSLMGMSPVMSSSTLDLSPLDIKWGILDQEPDTIKREPEKSHSLSLQNELQ